MFLSYGEWLAVDSFVKLYPILAENWDGSADFRRDVNAQRSLDSLGYGSVIPRWSAERHYRFTRNWGWYPPMEWAPPAPSTISMFNAARKMNSKSSVLAIKVGATNVDCGSVIGCLAVTTKGVDPYSFRPLAMDGVGEVPDRKVHSFAVNGCWIDEKYHLLIVDQEVPLSLNLVRGGAAFTVETTFFRTRQIASKPSLRQMLNRFLWADQLQLKSGDVVYFSTTPINVKGVSIHGGMKLPAESCP